MSERETFIQTITQRLLEYDKSISEENSRRLAESLSKSIGIIDVIDETTIEFDYRNIVPFRKGNRVTAWFDGKKYFLTYNLKSGKRFGVCLTEEEIIENFNEVENA